MQLTPKTVETIFEAGLSFARFLLDAFNRDDSEEVARLSSVLPSPLKSRLELQRQEEITRRELERKDG